MMSSKEIGGHGIHRQGLTKKLRSENYKSCTGRLAAWMAEWNGRGWRMPPSPARTSGRCGIQTRRGPTKKLRDTGDDAQSFAKHCLVRIPELSPQINKKNSQGDNG